MLARRFLLSLLVSCAALFAGSVPVASAAAPVVSKESFSDVGSGSARLSAQVTPNGEATTYSFEYGTSTAYGSSTAPASAGSGATPVGVVAPIGELEPETTYHFRVAAVNEAGEAMFGPDVVFETLPVGLSGLPDGRGYEMVTPPVNYDSNVNEPALEVQGSPWDSSEGYGPVTKFLFQAAVGGDAIAYIADPSVGGNGSTGLNGGNQYLARRSGRGVWSTRVIQPAYILASVFQAFSADLSVGILDSREALSANAVGGSVGEETYDDLYSTATSGSVYSPFFATKPPNRASNEFSGPEYKFLSGDDPYKPVLYAGGSTDMSHLLFEANDALTALAEQAVPSRKQSDLYDSVGGVPYLVDVLPEGKADSNATFGGLVPPFSQPDFSHAISANGSRVFWTDLNSHVLYVRENDSEPQSPLGTEGECLVAADACTVQVDLSHGPGSSGGGVFWTASADGSRVFFTDEKRLTGESTAEAGAPNLYEYDIETGTLRDLTVDVGNASVQGVIGASEDGSYVYFVAGDALASGASVQKCTPPTGLCNLYVLHDGEPIRFIAVLSGRDNTLSGSTPPGDWAGALGVRQAEVSADGRGLAFLSSLSLTGYQNNGQKELFVYDASGGGSLWCASCIQSGEPPANRPATVEVPVSWNFTYMHRFISDDGSRVFFDSGEALVAQDANGEVDAYEWERDGTGSCQRPQGCVYLLSGGASSTDSYVLDASAAGDDVFISTRAQLVPQDENEAYDIYDASVGFVQPLAPPACTGAGCQGVPGAPPVFATPSSVTFGGVGNFPASAGKSAVSVPKSAGKKVKKPKKKPKKRKKGRGRVSRRARAHRSANGGAGAYKRGGR